MPLILRPPRLTDESRVSEIQQQMLADDFDFTLANGTWAETLARFEREAAGIDLPEGRVPCDFLLAEVDGEIVGRVSIRHRLNEFLLEQGGHVGYGVAPEHRRRGYATEILRQSLRRLADLGVERVLVTCDDGNIGSARVIENSGGVLEDIRPIPGEAPKRRYWIEQTVR